ncbi:MAG: DUF115 domain-containing protein [Spirochaetaceae bacterium]|nr:MAG: DUF115 domain-containing protein [Spirochaetaceae bacterium]
MVDLIRARNGQLSAAANGRTLYSRYDPAAEAARFVTRELSAQSTEPPVVLIVGAGLGYLSAAVRAALPRSRSIAIHLDTTLYANRLANADHQWCGEDVRTDFARFLETHLSDEDIDGLFVLQWEPCVRVFSDKAQAILGTVRDFLDRRSATLATERHFGARWVANSVRNAIEARPLRQLKGGRIPVIVAAAGPSLCDSLATIAGRGAGVALWALSSAVPILLQAGCPPDLVIATDAGYFAAEHLRALATHPHIPIAAPLSARTALLLRRNQTLVINQGSWYERDLLQRIGLPSVQLPPHGTVAGTAWYLAAALGAGEVIFAGLDLCLRDIHSHPRGHAFEPLLRGNARRLRPYHHILFERNFVPSRPVHPTATVRISRPLSTYAAWFRSAAASGPVKAARLRPSEVDLGLPECHRLPRRVTAAVVRPAAGSPAPIERRMAVSRCVDQWRRQAEALADALAVAPGKRDRAQTRAAEIARSVDTAGYLRALRERRSGGCRGDAGEQLEQQLARFFDRLQLAVERAP